MENFFRQFGLPIVLVFLFAQAIMCIAFIAMPLEPVQPARVAQKGEMISNTKIIWEGKIVPLKSNEVAVNTTLHEDF